MSLEEGEEEAAAFSLQVQFLHMMEHPHDDVDDDMELDDEDDEEALMAMTMQQMLERGCDPHRLLQTDIEQLRRLLQAGLNPDLCLDDSMTSFLAHAAMAGHDDIVSLLLSYSANLESKNIFGNTPLQMVCKEHSGKANIIKTLLDFGADMNSVDMYGRTALLSAAEIGQVAAVEVLLDYAANVRATDKLGNSILDIVEDNLSSWVDHFDCLQRIVFTLYPQSHSVREVVLQNLQESLSLC